MGRTAILILATAALAALPACGREEDETNVAEAALQQAKEIENRAAALEAEVANQVNAVENEAEQAFQPAVNATEANEAAAE